MGTADWPLQKAIYNALTGASLTGSPTVTDQVARDSTGEPQIDRPFVSIGEMFDAPIGTLKDRSGQDLTATLYVESEAPGSKEIKQIKSDIHETLNRNHFDLSADGFNLFFAQVQSGQMQKFPRPEEGTTVRRLPIEVFYKIMES